ncbi:prepilin peptidase [bacterium]|nr:MAG: prepilin peptidase [bacterium]
MINKIFIFLFGSMIGSFLNVCIHRLPEEDPKKRSVVMPRSHCPYCGKTIRWYDNIPFLSYILLGGKCRFCKARISIRYFAVELITACFFLFFYNIYGLSFNFILYTTFISGLIVSTFVDIKHRIIPDEISVGGVFMGLFLGLAHGFKLNPLVFNYRPLLDSFLGVIIGGGIIYLTGFLFDVVYFKLLKKPPIQGETSSMGGGDVKLLAMIGAFLGWQQAVFTFFAAPLFGLGFALINLVVKKDHTMPYGPFLSLAALLSIFYFDKIIALLFI